MKSLGILNLLTKFVSLKTPSQLRQQEKSKGIVWEFVTQFYEYLDSGIPELQVFAAFSIANLSYLGIYKNIKNK